MAEADRCSFEAIQFNPKACSIQSTRGAVLVVSERVEEGMKLLQKSLKWTREPENRAWSLCYLTLGEHRLGRTQKRKELLETARGLDPECPVLDRIFRELSGGKEV